MRKEDLSFIAQSKTDTLSLAASFVLQFINIYSIKFDYNFVPQLLVLTKHQRKTLARAARKEDMSVISKSKTDTLSLAARFVLQFIHVCFYQNI